MNIRLDDNVWFGDWNSPVELKDKVNTIINVAHVFRRHGRDAYWKNLEQLSHKIFYVRHALKDRDVVTAEYFSAFETIVNQAVLLDKLPILCHCQMGRHRGPTSGIMVAWILNGKTKDCLEHFIQKATELMPVFAKRINAPYRKTITQFMVENSG